MRDNKSILLALLAVGLVVTWGYHLYDKSQYAANHPREVIVKDSSAVAKAVSDSLRVFFIQALNQLDPKNIQVDSLTKTLKNNDSAWVQKLFAVNQLRLDIGNMLDRENISKEELGNVRIKIDTLQKRMIELEKEVIVSNQDDKNFNGDARQLSNEVIQQNKKQAPAKNRIQSEKDNTPSIFTASGIHFAAYKVEPDQKEVETTKQEEANKFKSSFTVKNNAGSQNAEIIVVVSDPSGKSVNPEVWDAGSFQTISEGRKVYTRKLLFEYKKGEAKRLQFDLEPENFEKGVYKISLYHNGIRIGQTSWKLG
jgi:hypothetical protein